MKRRPHLPSLRAVAEWWRVSAPDADYLLLPDTALLDVPECWRCGASSPSWEDAEALERSHLVNHAHGGDSSPSNLVLLCRPCNREMPDFGPGCREAALDWLRMSPRPARADAVVVVARRLLAAGAPVSLLRVLVPVYGWTDARLMAESPAAEEALAAILRAARKEAA